MIKVERAGRDAWTAASQQLGKWSVCTTSTLPYFDLAERMASAWSESVKAFVAHREQSSASALLIPLAWDTQQLGRSTARIDYFLGKSDLRRRLLAAVLEECERAGIEYLTARVSSEDVVAFELLADAGFRQVDAIVTFSRLSTDVPHISSPGMQVRLATPEDADAVEELGRTVYRFDRFHCDPEITKEIADQVDAAWARNSVLGTAADAVWIAENHSGLLGFVTCKLSREKGWREEWPLGVIPLVATAERAQGQGVGKALTYAAVDWFREQGANLVEVGTQLSNVPASRLYESCGFRISGSSVTYRRVFKRSGHRG